MVAVSQQRVLPAAATALGSMPGSDPVEAAELVLGEFPEFSYLPELPDRGLGADLLGRTAAVLVDLAVEMVPSGYRIAARVGRHHRRAVDLLDRDLDGFSDAVQRVGQPPGLVKTRFAGPWTGAARIELSRGHRLMTDQGAHRDFVESFLEGLDAHVARLREHSGAEVVVQLDEPTLPAVLAGRLPTPSGYGTVPSVPEPEARELVSRVAGRIREMTGSPVVVHCGDRRPPVALLCAAGVDAVGLDATGLDDAPSTLLDEIGEAWDAGTRFLLGLVPATDPDGESPSLYETALPALSLVDRLGLSRSILAERALPTPVTGLAEASGSWLRRASSLVNDLAKAFVEPPQDW